MKQKKYAVFTMDVEAFADTECIRSAQIQVDADLMDGVDEYIKILNRHNIKSTLFTVGDLTEENAERLRPHIASGHKLALHSYTHEAPVNVPLDKFREKTRSAKQRMKELFGVEVQGFRAPCFSMDKERLEVLQELGFAYDSSHLNFWPARHTVKLDLKGFQKLGSNIFRNGDFYEFGLSNGRIFGQTFPISGGGYVRLCWWRFIKKLIFRHIHTHNYYVFYLHPFELTKQEIPEIKQLRLYDQYYIKRGVGTYDQRIEQIIQMLKEDGYEFVTFEQLTSIMNQEHCAALS